MVKLMENIKTIAAISTAVGVGGISIIRLSGSDAMSIASKVFSTKTPLNKIEPRKMYLGEFSAFDVKEKCLLVFFKSPNSYTGEDVVEFQCHGGVKLTAKILDSLIQSGATLAEAGEFTKRAFLNGKISLDEAEGVIDIINGESESEIKAGYQLMQGGLHKIADEIKNGLTDELAKIEVALDYPDEDIEEETSSAVLVELEKYRKRLNEILSTSKTGLAIKNGTRIVILGKTNVGKSSLMNAMLSFDKAIVTDIQGTTRDILEDTYLYKGAKFILVDTAGIRESADIVEKIGIERAKKAIDSADITLFVVDGSNALDKEDLDLINSLDKNKTILVVNKSDKVQVAEVSQFGFKNLISISASKLLGIDELKEKIYNLVFDEKIISSNILLTNIRHINSIKNAIIGLNKAISSIKDKASMDLVSLDIKEAWNCLGEITGQTETESIIDAIFSKFCVGK